MLAMQKRTSITFIWHHYRSAWDMKHALHHMHLNCITIARSCSLDENTTCYLKNHLTKFMHIYTHYVILCWFHIRVPHTDMFHNFETWELFKKKSDMSSAAVDIQIESAIPRFSMEGLPKFLNVAYFVLILWQTDKKTRNPEVKLQGSAYLDRTANLLIYYRIR